MIILLIIIILNSRSYIEAKITTVSDYFFILLMKVLLAIDRYVTVHTVSSYTIKDKILNVVVCYVYKIPGYADDLWLKLNAPKRDTCF
jgi:hypothetical protein